MTKSEFTCPNNHKFTTSAKLRARCPECGMMARRKFDGGNPQSQEHKSSSEIIPTDSSLPTDSTTSSSSISSTTEENPKTSESGSRPVSRLKNLPKPTEKKTLPRRKAVVVRQGRKKVLSSSVVKRKLAPSHSAPRVMKSPIGSKERKVVEELEGGNDAYWVKVKRKFFR